MVLFPERIQIMTPSGTTAALNKLAEAEGKRLADIVREAVTARLAANRRDDADEKAAA